MATVKVKYRPPSGSMKEGALYYQVIHNRIVRRINAGYNIYPTEWNSRTSCVLITSETEESRCRYLSSLEYRIKRDMLRMSDILMQLDETGRSYTADDAIRIYLSSPNEEEFMAFSQALITQLKQIGKIRTAESYTTVLNSFARFRGEAGDVLLSEINAGMMMEYETYLQYHGICLNSSSYYMRNLRAIYNRAVENKLVVQKFPFKHVYTGIGKTMKRAVSAKIIRQIRDLDLVQAPSMDYARDLFMFSFYTRGMSFIDMAYLKKKDLRNGILTYRRQKTKQQLFIKWEKPMQEIINKYDTTGTPYLLPIIKQMDKDERRQYLSAAHLTNNKLKIIGKLLGLKIPLTTYVARHGWASIAKSRNIPITTISEAMGHDSENTTRIYLSSLDTSVVDKANRLIIKSL